VPFHPTKPGCGFALQTHTSHILSLHSSCLIRVFNFIKIKVEEFIGFYWQNSWAACISEIQLTSITLLRRDHALSSWFSADNDIILYWTTPWTCYSRASVFYSRAPKFSNKGVIQITHIFSSCSWKWFFHVCCKHVTESGRRAVSPDSSLFQ